MTNGEFGPSENRKLLEKIEDKIDGLRDKFSTLAIDVRIANEQIIRINVTLAETQGKTLANAQAVAVLQAQSQGAKTNADRAWSAVLPILCLVFGAGLTIIVNVLVN